jgi:hypothetical protein
MLRRTLEFSADAFCGKHSGCHTLAVFEAFFEDFQLSDLFLFEALTATPFGVMSVPQDPNRLIVPRQDPDVGIDAALEFLRLDVTTQLQPRGTPPETSVRTLAVALGRGPVLLGPLDMGKLDYLPSHWLYSGCDHYVVALSVNAEGLWIRDGEGFDLALIDLDRFLAAWAAPNLREGRGSFTQRQIDRCRFPQIDTQTCRRALIAAARLVAECADTGPQIYHDLAARETEIMSWPAARRSIGYLLTARAQRSWAAATLIDMFCRDPTTPTEIARVKRLYLDQVRLIGGMICNVLRNEQGCLDPLHAIGELEADIATSFAIWECEACPPASSA